MFISEGDSYGSNTELQQQSSSKPQEELHPNLVQEGGDTLQHHRTTEEGKKPSIQSILEQWKQSNAIFGRFSGEKMRCDPGNMFISEGDSYGSNTELQQQSSSTGRALSNSNSTNKPPDW
ncbi:hypothetical protein T265_08880 [Opisthorchis viverrini]|uniref:Uncharacterized protein n=1 Tax=Opisthorchis viverrini TaxID=6198 RepID=A0A074ZIP0_OPIVI|nr:hypothetical protein T265_08880 [Opisthorchis viverrini]KER23185.1 hypothetical protein T265_08880 [Opisthorchis viverrini]